MFDPFQLDPFFSRKLGSSNHLPHSGSVQVSKRTLSIEVIQGSPTTVLPHALLRKVVW